jgi:tetratricopeptide (TPR) repeat protein
MILSRMRFAKAAFTALIVSVILPLPAPKARALASAIPPADGAAAIQTAQRQFNQGSYSSAITTLQAAVTQTPSSAEAHFWLGRSYYELRDFDKAVAQLEKSVDLDGKNSVYHQWLGRAYGGKADKDRSLFDARKVKKEFQAAVQLNPSNISAREDLEEYCIDAPWVAGGNKDEAKAQVEAIAALDPVRGHLARGVLYEKESKKSDLAEAEYRQVLSAKPKDMDVYFDVATFFQRQNKPSDMETAIQAAAQANPNDSRLAYYRGVSRVLSNTETARAEEYLKAYLATTPDRSDWPSHAAAREWLGRLFEAQGKRSEAAEQYREALQLEPGRKQARARLEQLEKSH